MSQIQMGQGLKAEGVSSTLVEWPFVTVLLLLREVDSFERITIISAQLVEKKERSITQKVQNFCGLY